MFLPPQQRLFNPSLNNPLHGGNGSSESSSPKIRMLDGDVSQQQTPSILRSPDSAPTNHNVRWSDPLCQFRTPMQEAQISDKDSNITSTSHMKLVPAFMLVSSEHAEQPGVVPVIPFMPSLQQPLSHSSRLNLEEMTRANLMPLMLSKGINTSPSAIVPHAQQPIPLQLQSTQYPQHFNTLSTTSFPNAQITIQAAQPLSPLDIGLNNSSSGFQHIPSEEGSATTTGKPLNASSAPKYHPMTGIENANTSSMPPKQDSHTHHPPSKSQQKKSPAKRLSSNSKSKLHHRHPVMSFMKRGHAAAPKTKLTMIKVIDWKNALSRFWFLWERDEGFTKEEYHNLKVLLSEINKNKNHPNLTLEWVEKAKIVEVLEKFERFTYNNDSSVGEMAGSILNFWSRSRIY